MAIQGSDDGERRRWGKGLDSGPLFKVESTAFGDALDVSREQDESKAI